MSTWRAEVSPSSLNSPRSVLRFLSPLCPSLFWSVELLSGCVIKPCYQTWRERVRFPSEFLGSYGQPSKLPGPLQPTIKLLCSLTPIHRSREGETRPTTDLAPEIPQSVYGNEVASSPAQGRRMRIHALRVSLDAL